MLLTARGFSVSLNAKLYRSVIKVVKCRQDIRKALKNDRDAFKHRAVTCPDPDVNLPSHATFLGTFDGRFIQ